MKNDRHGIAFNETAAVGTQLQTSQTRSSACRIVDYSSITAFFPKTYGRSGSPFFVLVDAKGQERASLVADNAGSAFLVMFDAAGKTRASLWVGNEGPSFILYDPSGQQRTVIGSTSAVASHVNDGGITEKGPASSIVLFDKAGKLIWRQP